MMLAPLPECVPERVLVTGGAGFIGSHLVDALVASGRRVSVIDDMSNGNRAWLEQARSNSSIDVTVAKLRDEVALRRAMAKQQLVFHLAGNADIPVGVRDTHIDLESAVEGTCNVLRAMVEAGVRDLLFTSSGAVYGNLAHNRASERSGPMVPLSLYAAGKLAAEAFIGAFCHLFARRAWIFRLGNVLGSRMPRGAIRDFARKLSDDPSALEILGDGAQRKNYFLVEDCLQGMLHAYANHALSEGNPCAVLNLGAEDSTGIVEIAREVAAGLGLGDVQLRFGGGSVGWPGDQPVVSLDVSDVHALGWRARHSSGEAVAIAVRRMLDYMGLRSSGENDDELRVPHLDQGGGV
jgi:UDP-glucose 4-epimerase